MTIKRPLPKLVFTALSLGLTLLIHQPSFAADAVANPDDAQIRSQLSAVAKYVTGKNSESLSSLWTKDGVYTDADGGVFRGREELHKRFEAAKEANAEQPIEMVPDEIRLLSGSVAEAEGSVRRKDAGTATPETRFSMVFTKEDGKWLIASATETPVTVPSSAEYLRDLSWLVGDWTANHDGTAVRMHGTWQGHKNFIRLNYEISRPNQPVQDDTEIIGFDPHTQEIMSWYFDSTGTTGQGVWQKNGSQWQIDVSKVSRDGVNLTARDMISVKNPDSFTWQAVDRTDGGVPSGDTAEVEVQRSK